MAMLKRFKNRENRVRGNENLKTSQIKGTNRRGKVVKLEKIQKIKEAGKAKKR